MRLFLRGFPDVMTKKAIESCNIFVESLSLDSLLHFSTKVYSYGFGKYEGCLQNPFLKM